MVKRPPSFELNPTEQESAGGDGDHAFRPVGRATDPDCWATATRICSEAMDAGTLAEVDAVRTHNEAAITDLTKRRPDLATLLSTFFADRRKALGGQGAS